MSFSGGSPSCRLKQVGVPRIDKSVCNIYYAGAIRFESKKSFFSSPLMPKQARSLFHGKPIQTFGIKKCSTWVGYVSTTNVWLGCISLPGTKQFFAYPSIMKKNHFITQTPAVIVIKPFFFISDEEVK